MNPVFECKFATWGRNCIHSAAEVCQQAERGAYRHTCRAVRGLLSDAGFERDGVVAEGGRIMVEKYLGTACISLDVASF